MTSVPPRSSPLSDSMWTSWGTGEELVKLIVTSPALAVASSLVKARLPPGSASMSRLEALPLLPPSASFLASSAFSLASSPTSSAFSPASSAFSSTSSAMPAAPVSASLELSEPQATSASAASRRANRAISFFISFLSRKGLTGRTLKALRKAPLPRSAPVELGRTAAEEGLDALAQVFGRHRVGDPVALQLQVLGDAVVEADPAEVLRHPHVVRRLLRQLLGLRP